MKKILVIDDSRLTLKLILAFLHVDFPDYEILSSQSGFEGMEIAKRELPDTILLDIIMPGIDGFEVCRILKNDESTSHIPILLVSAMGEMSYRVKGLNTGADAFISKPINRAELKAQVNVALRIKFAEDLLRKRNENLEFLIKQQTEEFHIIDERYSKVSEYALEFFWELDKRGQFTYVSPVIIKILGYGTNEILGMKSLYDFCSHKESIEYKEHLFDLFERRENFTGNEVLCLHKNGKKVWLAISGFPVFDDNKNFVGYIGVSHDITRRREAEEENKKHLEQINEYQKKLKKLNYELTLAEEKERRKIAEYLHDGLGQTISIASIKLSSIARGELPPRVKKTLEESSGLLRAAVNESRTLVYNLSPPVLYELGLVAAIKWKMEQIENQLNINTLFHSDENPLVLENDIKVLLFRMVCELLSNAIKHSEAGLIQVEIHTSSQSISVVVSDNGKGFDFKQETNLSELGGFGLFSINERLDSLQGSLLIESAPLQGTKITVTVPR